MCLSWIHEVRSPLTHYSDSCFLMKLRANPMLTSSSKSSINCRCYRTKKIRRGQKGGVGGRPSNLTKRFSSTYFVKFLQTLCNLMLSCHQLRGPIYVQQADFFGYLFCERNKIVGSPPRPLLFTINTKQRQLHGKTSLIMCLESTYSPTKTCDKKLYPSKGSSTSKCRPSPFLKEGCKKLSVM